MTKIPQVTKVTTSNSVLSPGILSPGIGIAGTAVAGTYSSSPYILTTTAGTTAVPMSQPIFSTLNLDGENADIVINKRSLTKILSGIEDRLGILTTNPALESNFIELRELGDRYRDLEQKYLEQTKVFDILKNTDR